MATTLMSIFNTIGVGIGFLIPAFFLPADSKSTNTKDNVFWLMMFEAILGSVMIIPSFLLFKEKPKNPPSYAAEVPKVPFKRAMSLIFTKNRNFLKLLFFFSMTLGNYNTLATVISALLKPFGFTDDDSGYIGFTVIAAGLIGACIFGFIVSKNQQYKKYQLICGLGAVAAAAVLMFAFMSETLWIVILGAGMLGFFITPTIPLSLELGCELTFPVGEALSSGVLMSGGQVVGLVTLMVFNYVFDRNSKVWVYAFGGLNAGLLLIGVFVMWSVEERLRRTRQEIKHESFRKSKNSPSASHASKASRRSRAISKARRAVSHAYVENEEDKFYNVEQTLLDSEERVTANNT